MGKVLKTRKATRKIWVTNNRGKGIRKNTVGSRVRDESFSRKRLIRGEGPAQKAGGVLQRRRKISTLRKKDNEEGIPLIRCRGDKPWVFSG